MEDLEAWVASCMRRPALDDAVVETLERKLVLEPDDVKARTQLVVHYWRFQLNRHGRARLADAQLAEAQLAEHSLWFIEHRPDLDLSPLHPLMFERRSPEGCYERARLAWLAAVDRYPQQWSVLVNASNFFVVRDTDLAIDLTRRCVALERDVFQWHELP